MSIPSIQKLTKEINALTTVVKSANMGGPTPRPMIRAETLHTKMGMVAKGDRTLVQGKGRDQPPWQLDHSNLDRNCSNATSVVVGVMDLENVPLQGGLDWRGLSGAVPPPAEEKGPKLENPQ